MGIEMPIKLPESFSEVKQESDHKPEELEQSALHARGDILFQLRSKSWSFLII